MMFGDGEDQLCIEYVHSVYERATNAKGETVIVKYDCVHFTNGEKAECYYN